MHDIYCWRCVTENELAISMYFKLSVWLVSSSIYIYYPSHEAFFTAFKSSLNQGKTYRPSSFFELFSPSCDERLKAIKNYYEIATWIIHFELILNEEKNT